MSNAIYPKWKGAIMTAAANSALNGGNLKAILVDTAAYTYATTHQYLTDIAAGARISTSGNMTGVSVADDVVDADDTTFSLVSGASAEAIVLFIDTGTEGTSRLVVYLDTGYTNLPVTPGGGNIQVAWDNGANKIFKL